MNYPIIKKIRDHFDKLGIDGYVIPKNDQFFSEFAALLITLVTSSNATL